MRIILQKIQGFSFSRQGFFYFLNSVNFFPKSNRFENFLFTLFSKYFNMSEQEYLKDITEIKTWCNVLPDSFHWAGCLEYLQASMPSSGAAVAYWLVAQSGQDYLIFGWRGVSINCIGSCLNSTFQCAYRHFITTKRPKRRGKGLGYLFQKAYHQFFDSFSFRGLYILIILTQQNTGKPGHSCLSSMA